MATLTTPRYGFPYPDGAERVMDGDNAIGALALGVESAMTGHAAILGAMVPILQRASAQLTLTTADVVIPGCSAVINPTAAETLLVLASFDFKVATAGVGFCYGAVYVDGVARPGRAIFSPATTGEETVTWMTTAAIAAGARTIDLRASKTINAGAASVESALGSTQLVILRYRATVLRDLAEAVRGELGLEAEGKPARRRS